MAAREVTVVFGEERFEMEVEVDMGVEVLQIQIFSLTGIEPENQSPSLPARIAALPACSHCSPPCLLASQPSLPARIAALPACSHRSPPCLLASQPSLPAIRSLSLSSNPSVDLSSPHADLASLLPASGAVLVLHDRGNGVVQGETGEKGAEGEGEEAGRKGESSREDDEEFARRLQGWEGESSREDDAELARRLQEEEDAALAQQIQQSEAHAMQAMLQQLQLRGGQQLSGGQQHGQAALQERLLSLWSNVMQYEDPSRQAKARSLIPLQQLEEAAAVSLAKQGQYQPSEGEFRDALLRQLLVWFKSWFRWVDSPPCPRCRTPTCAFHSNGTPSNEDLQWGGNRVELHRCKQCGTVARFVRYNDPAKLLDTREGRCGEWANAFTLCCRALGYDARQAVDWTDHVWTECYSYAKQRWMHLDPCEAAFDTPLLYEKGWGKKLTYVFGVGRDGVADVVRRYTQKWSELQHRRTEASEAAVAAAVAAVTGRARAGVSVDERKQLEERDAREQEELSGGRGGGDEGGEGGERDGVVLGGRQTGSVEWRAARGELGSDREGDGGDRGKEGKDGRLERRIVDEHVGALLLAIWKEREEEIQGREGTGWVIGVKECETQREEGTCGNGKGGAAGVGGWRYGQRAVLAAMGLQAAQEVLPRVKQALEQMRTGSGGGGDAVWLQGLVQHERVCGGWVSADGENPPNEMAISACDASLHTKWLHHEGGKGTWLQYRLSDSAPVTITMYSITSGNDCPERDPCCWSLQASKDGGKTWSVLDAQAGVHFSSRHQTKVFTISPAKQTPATLFRLVISAVQDPSCSCLQLACFDLYTARQQPLQTDYAKAPTSTGIVDGKSQEVNNESKLLRCIIYA
ncbi:unnamed protein product [Closterium sp. Yama58-4]|nr:unnamed protein product [Closterium sp. Yama58-4]